MGCYSAIAVSGRGRNIYSAVQSYGDAVRKTNDGSLEKIEPPSLTDPQCRPHSQLPFGFGIFFALFRVVKRRHAHARSAQGGAMRSKRAKRAFQYGRGRWRRCRRVPPRVPRAPGDDPHRGAPVRRRPVRAWREHASRCVTSATAPKDVSGGATRASHSSVRPTARCTSARGADQPAGTIPRNCGANSTATRASR